MTAMVTAAPPAVRPTLRRDPARGRVGGVCAGLADRLGVDVLRALLEDARASGAPFLTHGAVLARERGPERHPVAPR